MPIKAILQQSPDTAMLFSSWLWTHPRPCGLPFLLMQNLPIYKKMKVSMSHTEWLFHHQSSVVWVGLVTMATWLSPDYVMLMSPCMLCNWQLLCLVATLCSLMWGAQCLLACSALCICFELWCVAVRYWEYRSTVYLVTSAWNDEFTAVRLSLCGYWVATA